MSSYKVWVRNSDKEQWQWLDPRPIKLSDFITACDFAKSQAPYWRYCCVEFGGKTVWTK